MRYALECPVESRISLKEDFHSNWFGKLLSLSRDQEGIVNKIRLEAAVPPEDDLKHLVTVTGGRVTHIGARGSAKIHRQLETDLQSIESTLGYYFGLKRIRWELATSY